MRRIALYGGTFDPIHHGHLAAAHTALASGLVDEVVFIPAGEPPHKPAGPSASAADRWCMTVLATLQEPAFQVVRWEFERHGPSYTVDTVRHARATWPEAELYWLIGTDAMATIGSWHEAETLLALTSFLVIARRGYDEGALRAHLAQSAPGARMHFLPMALVDVSSTALRARLAAGQKAEEALPPLVSQYLNRYKLYNGCLLDPGKLRREQPPWPS